MVCFIVVDTAFNYNNEEAIGRALKKWFDAGGNREDLFVTTKVSPPFKPEPSTLKFLAGLFQTDKIFED